jgi:hypothetical protein
MAHATHYGWAVSHAIAVGTTESCHTAWLRLRPGDATSAMGHAPALWVTSVHMVWLLNESCQPDWLQPILEVLNYTKYMYTCLEFGTHWRLHPAGKNPTNTPYALHAWFVYGFGPCISHGLRRTIFHQSPRSRNKPLHQEEVLTTKDRLAQPSFWVASFFLPCDSPRVGERDFSPVVTHLI